MKNITILKNELDKIEQKGWIKCEFNGSSKVGHTIEQHLGIKRNKDEKPDFLGIEIKTKSTHSKSLLTLFSANPDSSIDVITKIHSTYSYPSKVDKRYNVFNVSVDAVNITHLANHNFKLRLDEHTIVLEVYDKFGILIDDSIYWSFTLLKDKLLNKFKQLCIIYTINKKKNDDFMFLISKYNIYKLTDYDTFIQLIRDGKIRVSFRINIYKSGERLGQIHNHGTAFEIKDSGINILFEKVQLKKV